MKGVILDPSGNITAFVLTDTIPENKQEIAKSLLKQYLHVEQVGFLVPHKKELIMAGGEFCGNAARAAVRRLLGGKIGETTLRISGYDKAVLGEIDKDNNVTITLGADFCYTISYEDQGFVIVYLQGITHMVVPVDEFCDTKQQELMLLAQQYLAKYNLLSEQAAGVMFVKGQKLTPIVWVRDMHTCICENACGSGTIAYALYKHQLYGEKNIELIQPSGEMLRVTLNNDTISLSGTVGVVQEI